MRLYISCNRDAILLLPQRVALGYGDHWAFSPLLPTNTTQWQRFGFTQRIIDAILLSDGGNAMGSTKHMEKYNKPISKQGIINPVKTE